MVPQEIIFDPFFTPRETLEIQAGMYGVPAAERKSDELLAAMHLTDKANAYARTLSGGMKRRLLVAKAMVHSPPILVLDEPTAGVDVELRRQLWDYVRELNAAGRDDRAHHPLSRGSRAAVRPDRDHPPRPGDRQRADARAGRKAQEKAVVVTFDHDIANVPANPLLRKHRADRRAHARNHLSQGQGERGPGARRAHRRRARLSSTSRPGNRTWRTCS